MVKVNISKNKIIFILIVIIISLLITSKSQHSKLRYYELELGRNYISTLIELRRELEYVKYFLNESKELKSSNLIVYHEILVRRDISNPVIRLSEFSWHLTVTRSRIYDLWTIAEGMSNNTDEKIKREEVIILTERLLTAIDLVVKEYNDFNTEKDIRRCYKELPNRESVIIKKVNDYFKEVEKKNPIVYKNDRPPFTIKLPLT